MAAERLNPAEFMTVSGDEWQRWTLLTSWVLANYQKIPLQELAAFLRPYLRFEPVDTLFGPIPIDCPFPHPLFRSVQQGDGCDFSLYLGVNESPRLEKLNGSLDFEELASYTESYCTALGASCAFGKWNSTSSPRVDIDWRSPDVLPVMIHPEVCLPRMLAYHEAWRGLVRLDSRSVRAWCWRWKIRRMKDKTV